jgi:hypothetical protein
MTTYVCPVGLICHHSSNQSTNDDATDSGPVAQDKHPSFFLGMNILDCSETGTSVLGFFSFKVGELHGYL